MKFNHDKFDMHLGKPFVQKYVSNFLEKNETVEVFESDEVSMYYIMKERGLDYRFEKLDAKTIELSAIFIYVNNLKEGYIQFQEELPFSIETRFRRSDINNQFGIPDKLVETLPIIRLDHRDIYYKSGYSLIFEYNKKEKIKFILIEITE